MQLNLPIRQLGGVGLAVLAACALVVFTTAAHGGLGTTPDSASYIAAARHLLAGQALTDPYGLPYVLWPPGYPMVLATLGWLTRLDPFSVAPWANGLALAAVWAMAAGRLRPEGWVGRAALLWLVGSPAILHSAFMALSDVVFVALEIGCLIALTRYYEAGRTRWLLAAAVLTALACLVRYVGLSLIIAGLVVVTLRARGWLNWAKLAGLYGGLATLPPALWALHNLLTTGAVAGPRYPSAISLSGGLQQIAVTIAEWFMPVPPGTSGAAGLAVGVMVVLAGLMAAYILRRPAGLTGLVPAAVFIVSYVVVLAIMASSVAFEPIGDRLLLPIYVPLLWIGARAVRKTGELPLTPQARRWLKLGGVAASGLSLAWVGLLLLATLMGLRGWLGQRGYGYPTAGAMQYLQTNGLPAEPVYSNEAAAIYLFAGAETNWLPERRAYNAGGPDLPISQLAGVWPASFPVMVVYFNANEGRHFSPAELAIVYTLDPVAIFSDSGVYKLTGLAP